MSEFNALVDEVKDVLWEQENLLAKARKPDADDAADDARIKAAADGDEDDDGEPDSEDAVDDFDDHEEEGEDADEDEDESAPLKKALTVTLDDGSAATAYDGAALIKSFRDQVAAVRTETHEDLVELTRALVRSTQLLKSLREQSDEQAALIKAHGDQLQTLRTTGSGRKSSLSIHERPVVGDEALAKTGAMDPSRLLVKALDAQRAGRLTGLEVAQIDACLHRGMAVPETLLNQIGD